MFVLSFIHISQTNLIHVSLLELIFIQFKVSKIEEVSFRKQMRENRLGAKFIECLIKILMSI